MSNNNLVKGLLVLLAAILLVAPRAGFSAAQANCDAKDQSLWLESEFAIVEENLEFCGVKSLGQANGARDCLRPRSELSDLCLECQVNLIVCTASHCSIECANGGRKSSKCVSCVEEKSPCNSNFITCTGFDFPKCPNCNQAPGSGDGFIPGMSLAASIGVVAGGSVGGAALIIILIYCMCIRERKADFKPASQLGSQHSGHNLLTGYSSSPLMTLDKSFSFSNGPASPRLYADSEDVAGGGAAYMFGMGGNSSRQLGPDAPIMKDI